MNLDSEEKQFLEVLIKHSIKTSRDWRKTLIEANIPLTQKFNKTYPESFSQYKRDEKR